MNGAPYNARRRRHIAPYYQFAARYQPITCCDGSVLRDWTDDAVQKADIENIWTVIDTGAGLYLIPGACTVNYFARVMCAVKWGATESENPGYRYA